MSSVTVIKVLPFFIESSVEFLINHPVDYKLIHHLCGIEARKRGVGEVGFTSDVINGDSDFKCERFRDVVVHNKPINLSLISEVTIEHSCDLLFEDNTYESLPENIYKIKFKGENRSHYWQYATEEERNADYERIIKNRFKGGSSD